MSLHQNDDDIVLSTMIMTMDDLLYISLKLQVISTLCLHTVLQCYHIYMYFYYIYLCSVTSSPIAFKPSLFCTIAFTTESSALVICPNIFLFYFQIIFAFNDRRGLSLSVRLLLVIFYV